MRRLFFCWLLSLPLLTQAQLPFSRYIIPLTDKKGTPFGLDNPKAFLSAQSWERRTRQGIALDSTDLPVSGIYLDSIGSVPNVTILNVSKWLNQVLIRTTDSAALARIQAFPFTRQAIPIAAKVIPLPDTGHAAVLNGLKAIDRDKTARPGPISRNASNNLIDYGSTYVQIHMHNGDYLHNLGFQGQGMTIAVIDDGFFGYLGNPVFDSVRTGDQILGSWDFVNEKQSVDQEDIHGMYCLSTMAANRPGLMVGSAPKAKYWLFKTEDLSSEYPVEEQNWAAAAEMADSAGAYLISTSLGYTNFDDPAMDHTYAERNGHTAISTRAANFASAKGMIVVAAAGNSGASTGDTKFVGCPADADSALTVGAIDRSGVIASFSSWGPNSAGRVKPDVVSLGIGTILADTLGYPTSGNGTSFSTPNLAGLIACLWEAFPDFSPSDILAAVRKSAPQSSSPDDRYGYGLPDFKKAFGLLQTERGVRTIISQNSPGLTVFPVPYTNDFTVVFQAAQSRMAALMLMDASGRCLEKTAMSVTAGEWYTTSFATASQLPSGAYIIRYEAGNQVMVARVVKQ